MICNNQPIDRVVVALVVLEIIKFRFDMVGLDERVLDLFILAGIWIENNAE